jgi:hypothetical protein
MVSDLIFSQLMLIALLWLCVMLHGVWPSDPTMASPTLLPATLPPPKRSREPKPFAGLTRKPHCDACEQAVEPHREPPCAPPPRMVMTRGRPRQVDTSHHFCPDPDCPYGGWLGLGNISANGLPTICQPQFVNFLPHLHDWLTTNSAGIIAGTSPQHGHQDA